MRLARDYSAKGSLSPGLTLLRPLKPSANTGHIARGRLQRLTKSVAL